MKELALIDPDDALPVTQLTLRKLPHLMADTPMYDLLHLFQVRVCDVRVCVCVWVWAWPTRRCTTCCTCSRCVCV